MLGIVGRNSLQGSRALALTRVVPQVPDRGMAANAKVLKARLKTIGSIKRITSTMKMVAASKLRGFQTRMEQSRPLQQSIASVFDRIPEAEVAEGAAAAKPDGAHLIIGMASDRGLCGGINSSIVKAIRRITKDNVEVEKKIVTVGDKPRTALTRTHGKMFQFSVNEVSKAPPTFLVAALLAEELNQIEYASCTLVYNKFISAIAYETTEIEMGTPAGLLARLPKFGEQYEFEGDETNIMSDLIQMRIAVQLFNSMLESATCEQSARMAAMDGASKNCGEMIDKLTTVMNRARQAAITTELCEIVAGAEAIAAS